MLILSVLHIGIETWVTAIIRQKRSLENSVRLILGNSTFRATGIPMAAANKRGRRGGRPKAMNEQIIKHAEAMLEDIENYPFIGDVID